MPRSIVSRMENDENINRHIDNLRKKIQESEERMRRQREERERDDRLMAERLQREENQNYNMFQPNWQFLNMRAINNLD